MRIRTHLLHMRICTHLLEYIFLVCFPPEYIYLVQSTSHSVFVGLVVRVRYVSTHLLGFQHMGNGLKWHACSTQTSVAE